MCATRACVPPAPCHYGARTQIILQYVLIIYNYMPVVLYTLYTGHTQGSLEINMLRFLRKLFEMDLRRNEFGLVFIFGFIAYR